MRSFVCVNLHNDDLIGRPRPCLDDGIYRLSEGEVAKEEEVPREKGTSTAFH